MYSIQELIEKEYQGQQQQYNKQQKVNFLNSIACNLNAVTTRFVVRKLKNISVIETTIDRDLSLWSEHRVLEMLKNNFSYTEDIILFYSIFLQPYFEYCGKNIEIDVTSIIPQCIYKMPNSVLQVKTVMTPLDRISTKTHLTLTHALGLLSWYGAEVTMQTIQLIDFTKLVSKNCVYFVTSSKQIVAIDLKSDLEAKQVFNDFYGYLKAGVYKFNHSLIDNCYGKMGAPKWALEVGGLYTRMKKSGIKFDTYENMKAHNTALTLKNLSQYFALTFYYKGQRFATKSDWDKFYNRYVQWLNSD